MDSLKTKAKCYVEQPDHKCITQIMAVAEPVIGKNESAFRIYVAWEWGDMARKGVYGFCKSREQYKIVTNEAIQHVADYGWDIGGSGEEKRVFKNLF